MQLMELNYVAKPHSTLTCYLQCTAAHRVRREAVIIMSPIVMSARRQRAGLEERSRK